MSIEKINKYNAPVTLRHTETGEEYSSRILAFKNGVLYVELVLDLDCKKGKYKRSLAIQAAKYFRKENDEFQKSLASKISVFYTKKPNTNKNSNENFELIHDSTIGIIFQDGLLN
ncbi:hypothetical protein [Membranihabitans maritimus]|uniref:hypothetical protein n=1 Tax=Membranihabitans maritimus TaxID=2904244 RepID=UPI001F3E0B1E|nr:hypothetical protein [Membranihabitans maritimus]